MKTKIQKFYHDHKTTINLITVGTVGAAAAAVTTYYLTKEAKALADANLYTDTTTGTRFLNVELKDGTFKNYLWQDNEND